MFLSFYVFILFNFHSEQNQRIYFTVSFIKFLTLKSRLLQTLQTIFFRDPGILFEVCYFLAKKRSCECFPLLCIFFFFLNLLVVIFVSALCVTVELFGIFQKLSKPMILLPSITWFLDFSPLVSSVVPLML